jgi:hypothetical protein
VADEKLEQLQQALYQLANKVDGVHEAPCNSEVKPSNHSLKSVQYPSAFVAQHAADLAALIKQSVIDVNNVSEIDGEPISLPQSIKVDYRGGFAETFAYGVGEYGPELTIGYANFCKLKDMADLKSILDHEFGHAIPNPPSDQKCAELRSDRYADAMDRVASMLNEIHRQPWRYDYDSAKSTHPCHRERIQALLEEHFGNAVFGMNGSFSNTDFKFHPKQLDGMPATGDGRKVTNWAQIAQNMAAPIDAAMHKLTVMMNDRSLSEDEAKQWLADVSQQAAVFKRDPQNQPQFESVARQSEAGLSTAALEIVATQVNQQIQHSLNVQHGTSESMLNASA